MLPALWSGDAVAVDAARLSELEPGDVAVFVRNRHLVVHRVVRRTAGRGGVAVVTRGDAQRDDDPPVGATEILGVVRTIHRFGADRPLPRRPAAFACGIAWIVRRSPLVRHILDRLNSVLVDRAAAARSAGAAGASVLVGQRRVNPT